ncbi:MAG TPA: hypothetical protein VGG46_03570 [Terriglobales bacterium]
MGRLRFHALAIAVYCLIFGLSACGGGNAGNQVVANPTPAIILLAPSPKTSLELGKTVVFSTIPEDASGAAITTPVQFVSSNSAVVTVASSGLACAGTWNSLSNPQICTPGQTGVAQITAVAQGVSSPSTTVYVHQHVDKVVISAAPSQNPLVANCISKGHTFIFQANGFSQGTDITSSLGPFLWSAANASVVDLSTTAPGLALNQAQATASTIGLTTISASAASTNSIATPVTVCPVASISLTANGSSNTDLTVPQGTSISAIATTMDTAGNNITGVPLTWSSSNASSVNATGLNNTATIGTPLPGGGTVIASCTPPSCNAGFQPSQPVYPANVIRVVTGQTSTTPSHTVLVTSDGCANLPGCVSTIVAINTSGGASSPANTANTAANLTATPNSLVVPLGTTTGSAFLGTDFSQQSTKGLMVLASAGGVTQFPSAPGKVLAVSPNGNLVIVSDTADAVNQVYLFNVLANTSTPFSIVGATAAAFSPDSLKAFVVAGSNLYIISTQDALQIVPLGAAANGVAFLPEGGFAYIATGASVTPWLTCSGASVPAQTVTTSAASQFLQPLNLAQEVQRVPSTLGFDQIQNLVAVDSPGIDLIASQVNVPSLMASCPLDVVSNPGAATFSGFFNLGRGSFVPKQLLVSSDGSKVYIVTSNLSVILTFDLTTHASSAIALSGGATPLAAALTPDGGLLYVGASDDQVHAIDTNAGVDIQQVTFQRNLCLDSVGNPLPTVCLPDIIAVRP